MWREYFGILDGREGSYSIVIPDFPDCHGKGSTFGAAVENASASISHAARRRLEAGQDLPAERDLGSVLEEFRSRTGQFRSGGVAIPLKLDQR